MPNVVVKDMEENFPFNRKPSKLRERAKLARDKRVRELLLNLAKGSRKIDIEESLDELVARGDSTSKALLLIALYYPVRLADENPADPEAASILINSRILLQEAGLEKAAENLSKSLAKLGRALIAGISEIADPEYAKKAARAAVEIGKAIGDELLKAFGVELLRYLGEPIEEEYTLDEEELIELKLTLAATLLTLGLFEAVKEVLKDVDIPQAHFIRAVAAILSDDKETRGMAIAKLREMEFPEAKFFLDVLEAIRCARIGDEKCFDKAIAAAQEKLAEVPELVGVLEFIKKLKA